MKKLKEIEVLKKDCGIDEAYSLLDGYDFLVEFDECEVLFTQRLSGAIVLMELLRDKIVESYVFHYHFENRKLCLEQFVEVDE